MTRRLLECLNRFAFRIAFVLALLAAAWFWKAEKWLFPAAADLTITRIDRDWPIGGTARYRGRLIKRRDCRVEVERYFSDRSGREISYATRLRTLGPAGSIIDLPITVAVPPEMQPGPGAFRVELRYWCNELFPQIFRSRPLQIRFVERQTRR